ncbi:MAG: type II secretion system minor pseudopilin GspI [Leptospirales bacterium]
MNPKKNDQGFTLLEVMVALFIFSVAVLALLAARNQSIKLNEVAREQVIMTLLGDRKLAEVVGQGFTPVGQASGFFGKTYRQYRWKEEITPSPFPIVRQVTVTITKGHGKKKTSLSFVSFISSIP